MSNDQKEEVKTSEQSEKIVNLFEDNGNIHNEEELSKSYDRVAATDKK